MNTFFTSDWHIGHKNVIEFDKRPFTDLDDMHSTLVRHYNKIVGPKDVCYFLGDIVLGKLPQATEVISQLNSFKIVILGNHDRGAASMRNVGFDAVLTSASLMIEGQLVTMSHCPLRGVYREDTNGMRGADGTENWHGEKKHVNYSFDNYGQFHLHGHTHKADDERIVGRQWDVGVRANAYRPVYLSHVEKWIRDTINSEKPQ